MPPRRVTSSLALCLLLALSGCGYVHVGKLPPPATTVVGDDKLMKENSDLKLEKKMLQQELALTRSQGDALRFALENRNADGDTSKRLVEKLNETSRELGVLRAGYAQLQLERNRAVATAAEATALKARLGATEEQLANSLRTYTQLQEEVTRLRTDVDRTRTENVALGEQVKTITAQNEQAQAALAQLNTDLLAQKDARFRAEQDAETLRTELKTAAPNSSALAQQRTGAAADARSIIAEHAAETAALKQQLTDLRGKVDALNAERVELKQQLGGSEAPRPPAADLANVEAKLSTALRNASLLRDENEQLKGQLTQLKNGAAGAAGADTLRDQLKDAQAQAMALAEENARLKSRIASAASPTPPPAATQVMPPPTSITTGAVTLTPRPSGVNATLVTSVPGIQRTAAVRVESAPSAPKADALAGRVHVVSGGDTLAKISTQYYGSPTRWSEILAANRDVLGESNNLVVGRTLRIP
jgi:nucleoid-associated protein YgaU